MKTRQSIFNTVAKCTLVSFVLCFITCTKKPDINTEPNKFQKNLVESAEKRGLLLDTLTYRYTSNKTNTLAFANVFRGENLCDSASIRKGVNFSYGYISIPNSKLSKEGYYVLKFTSVNKKDISAIIFENSDKKDILTISEWGNQKPTSAVSKEAGTIHHFNVGAKEVTVTINYWETGSQECIHVSIDVAEYKNGTWTHTSQDTWNCTHI